MVITCRPHFPIFLHNGITWLAKVNNYQQILTAKSIVERVKQRTPFLNKTDTVKYILRNEPNTQQMHASASSSANNHAPFPQQVNIFSYPPPSAFGFRNGGDSFTLPPPHFFPSSITGTVSSSRPGTPAPRPFSSSGGSGYTGGSSSFSRRDGRVIWNGGSGRATTSSCSNNNFDHNGQVVQRRKLVIVGDGEAGKTSMLVRLTTGVFPTEYVPTVFETRAFQLWIPDPRPNRLKKLKKRLRESMVFPSSSSSSSSSTSSSGLLSPTVIIDGEAGVVERGEEDFQLVELGLWDTAGQEDYDRLRPLSYPNTQVVLVCFPINSPSALNNVRTRWYPEVRHFCQQVPVILVGCKSDLRMTGGGAVIPYDHCEAMAKYISARSYMECSAMTGEGLHEVFMQAAMEAFRYDKLKRKSRGCLMM